MLTRNMKNILAMGLQSAAATYGALPVVDVTGRTWYHPGGWSFPASRTDSATTNATAAGISVGSGSTPPGLNDVNLEDTITSGVSLSIAAKVLGCDPPESPWLQYRVTVTNTGSSPVTVREIGYKQKLKGTRWPEGTSADEVVCLIDRTVLATPITIQPGDAGVVLYKLKTNATPARTIGGVEIVSWTWGTDAQIAAMIAAARAGTIDLQQDAGWRVGDARRVHIDAFSSPNVNHAAQDVALVISSFEEYEGCGNVMQFDFYDALAAGNRMNSSNTNAGGYGQSEMKTDTLPALEAALPSWLRSLLLTFSVKASEGSQSDTIETVTGNKLALRSEVEIFGATTYSKPGEGVQVDLYKITGYRSKTTPANSWWERSPNGSSSSNFCYVSDGSPNSNTATRTNGVAPFGCI